MSNASTGSRVRVAIIGAGAVSDYHHVPALRLDPPANERLDELQVPTLVMVGDLDERTTQLSCRRLAEVVPGARFEEFSGAAHMLNLEQPEKFNRLVLDFLASVGA